MIIEKRTYELTAKKEVRPWCSWCRVPVWYMCVTAVSSHLTLSPVYCWPAAEREARSTVVLWVP